MKIPVDPELQKAARQRMQGCLTYTILFSGLIAGLDTVRDCMKDPDIRPFLGHALLHEIMPNLGLNRDLLDPMAMAVCGEMEHPGVVQPLPLLLNHGVQAWKNQALPLLKRFQDREDAVPPCLCMGLSTLIMLFSGAKQEEDGRFTYLHHDEPCALIEEEDTLLSFSRLSCDMPPEMLAYAVLSDRALWEEDLRDVPGLEDRIADQLRDLQLIGLRASLSKAWQDEEE
ncbi:MAG: hypothetical protein IJ662_08485 [Clostridia bacterium]|nr:hypothetical protein [Clostridia bacterium]